MIYPDLAKNKNESGKFVFKKKELLLSNKRDRGVLLSSENEWDFGINLKNHEFSDFNPRVIDKEYNHPEGIYKRIQFLEEFKPSGSCKALEIGVRQGFHARQMMEVLNPDELVLVDIKFIFSEGGDKFKKGSLKSFDTLSYENVNLIEMPSVDASSLFDDDYFDFIYIDARHDYHSVMLDINSWMPKLKTGGVMCGHDYNLIYHIPGSSLMSGEKIKNACDYFDNPLTYMNNAFSGKSNLTSASNRRVDVCGAVNDYVHEINRINKKSDKSLLLELRFQKETMTLVSEKPFLTGGTITDATLKVRNMFEWALNKV